MGYESRVYVIRKMDVPYAKDTRGFKYAEVMAVYGMSKFQPFQQLFDKNCPVTKYAFFNIHGGGNLITEDMYGDPLRERSLGEAIDCLEQVIAQGDDLSEYPRIKPLLALLREYDEIQNSYYQFALLHYGH